MIIKEQIPHPKSDDQNSANIDVCIDCISDKTTIIISGSDGTDSALDLTAIVYTDNRSPNSILGKHAKYRYFTLEFNNQNGETIDAGSLYEWVDGQHLKLIDQVTISKEAFLDAIEYILAYPGTQGTSKPH